MSGVYEWSCSSMIVRYNRWPSIIRSAHLFVHLVAQSKSAASLDFSSDGLLLVTFLAFLIFTIFWMYCRCWQSAGVRFRVFQSCCLLERSFNGRLIFKSVAWWKYGGFKDSVMNADILLEISSSVYSEAGLECDRLFNFCGIRIHESYEL